MRLEILSKIPTATATQKNFSIFLLKNLVVKKKVLTFAAAIEKKAKVL